MIRTILATAFTLFVSASAAFAGETYTVDKDHSDVTFQVRHLMSKVRGVFTDFGGTVVFEQASPETSSVEFRIKTASIDTNNQKRDDHLRTPDFFDAATHPEIVFKSTKIVRKSGNTFDVHGNLTLRGVTKAVVLPVTYLGQAKDAWGNTKVSWATEVTLNRKDYGIVWNSALDAGGFVLGDDVEVTINLQAAPVAPRSTN